MDIIKKNMETILMPVENHLEFSLINEKAGDMVRHCFSTRLGGVSKGIYESMNLSYSRGDKKEDVDENFRRIANVFGKSSDRIVCSNQTHTTNVIEIKEEHAGNGVVRDNEFVDVDGMITNIPGIILGTFYADCVPLYFVDVENRAIGLSHSGWRGTVGRIGRETIKLMGEKYGTRSNDLICAIGPSICMECYEISEDVAIEFEKEFPEHKDRILIYKGNGKYHLDLWKVNEIILLEAGVKKENIAITNVCTCCNHKLLFSHRASNGRRGNLGAFLMIMD